jgi:hypothetical protein
MRAVVRSLLEVGVGRGRFIPFHVGRFKKLRSGVNFHLILFRLAEAIPTNSTKPPLD